MTTTVLPGHKIEITAPELPVGGIVEVTVSVPVSPATAPNRQALKEFLDSRPPSRRTLEEWAQFERDFQEERNSWDR
jgi:hypothetical protein